MDIAHRIKRKDLLTKIMTAEEAAQIITDGMHVGVSGFTPSGYPKAVPLALAERVKKGERIRLTLGTGASVGQEIDETWAPLGIIARRYPYKSGRNINSNVNAGDTRFIDIHLSQVAQQLRFGYLPPMDVCIIEAVCILENGGIVPSTAVGNAPVYVEQAKKIIVEINTSQPIELMGMHDIYSLMSPPDRLPIPLTNCSDRIGTPYIPCDPSKIVAIVHSDIMDKVRSLAPIDDVSCAIAAHLIHFFKKEYGNQLPPIQSGVGALANAVLAGLAESQFEGLRVWSEVIQDAVFDLIDADMIASATGTSLSPSPAGRIRFFENIGAYRKKIILRPQEISNNPEIARRLGIIAMNTALEADIYGNTNSTHIMGTTMVNGIGGSGDFSRSAGLVIMMTSSVTKGGAVSCIVPHVTHVDHTEHDVHIIVTEQGLADLRGLSPQEKVPLIIDKCAHPDYRPILRDYFQRALNKSVGHTPMLLDEAYTLHVRYLKTGSMK
ncbi:MAG: Succinyl-CoA:coenzyme A transferase [Syntrophus sp. SKADARSKE-3]|nr:Succinyl-CoA:coenzyme A transferase [Syntrophus sp. SKADARSKE-3]